jgi:hypothetical protein
MNRILLITLVSLVVFILCWSNVRAGDDALTVGEFRQLYDSLLAGKTLVSELKKDGINVKKERIFGKAISTGNDEFELPIKIIITTSEEGAVQQKRIIDVWDVVRNVGGSAVVSEKVIRQTTVEDKAQEPLTISDVEFVGDFRVSKNDNGGFDVHNFGLQPSVLVKDGKTSLAGNMVLYSCFPENGVTKCVLTVRDYVLGEYKPLEGFTLVEPAGGDVVEVGVEVKK